MHLTHRPQPVGGLLRGDVPLGTGQHLVAHHELFDRGRAQEGRVEVGVQLPVGIAAAVRGLAVPAHAVGEAGLEEVVVAGGQPLENRGQGVPLGVGEVGEGLHRPPGQEHGLEGPDRPKGDQGHPMVVFHHDARAIVPNGQFGGQIVHQQGRAVVLEVGALGDLFLGRFHGHPAVGPDLAVGVGVGAAHHRAFVLEDLHIVDAGTSAQIHHLLGPHIHHPADVCGVHLGQGEVVPGAEADHPAGAGLRLGLEEGAAAHIPPGPVQKQGGKIILKDKGVGVVGILRRAPRPLIAGAKITFRVVGRAIVRRRFLHLSLPRPFGAVGRDQHPFAVEDVTAAVGVFGGVEGGGWLDGWLVGWLVGWFGHFLDSIARAIAPRTPDRLPNPGGTM